MDSSRPSLPEFQLPDVDMDLVARVELLNFQSEFLYGGRRPAERQFHVRIGRQALKGL